MRPEMQRGKNLLTKDWDSFKFKKVLVINAY